jgi:hypothetical protein
MPPAFPDDWSGAMARTFSLPNNVVSVAVADEADAVTIRLHDGTTYVLRAADVGPVAPGADAREAVSEAVYRTCLAHQRIPA